jgi:hypothetical protein
MKIKDIDIVDIFTALGIVFVSSGLWLEFNLNFALMFAGGYFLFLGIIGSR